MTRAVTVLALIAITATPAHASSERVAVGTVTVKPGDTLSTLFADSPGGPFRAAFVNGIADPNHIEVGQMLTAPTRDGRRWQPRPTQGASRTWTRTPPPSGSSSSLLPPASSSGSPAGGNCGGSLPTCEIMECESGGSLTAENPTSSASGKWAFIDSTWDNFGGYAHAKDAPESVQDEKARQVWDGGRGRSHWVC